MTTRLTVPSDLEAKAASGDGAAFGELIRKWDDDLRGVVWSIVRSVDGTDDVMQSAYEKGFRSLANFGQQSSMKTWLTSICVRVAIDHTRYERHRSHDSTNSLLDAASGSSTSQDAITRTELAAALDSLEPETRGLLMLTVGLGYSFDEAAQITDLPRGTVASRVARAKKAIRSARQAAETHGEETTP